MNENVEGTIVLNGLVEGYLPDEGQIEDQLQRWVSSLKALRLRFNLETSGNSFSILPDNDPTLCDKLGDRPDDVISQALEQLLELLPEDQRARVVSTLHSSEFRKGEEVQAVYFVTPDGSIRVESRTLEAKTTPPPEPISVREKVRLAVYGLVFAMALLFIISLFFDLRGLFGHFASTLKPFNSDEIEVDVSTFQEYFTVEKKEIVSKYDSHNLVITLKRTEAFPRDEAQLNKAMAEAGDSVNRRLALDALARGYVRCETFNTESRFSGYVEGRVGDLRTKETVKVAVPLQKKDKYRLKRVKITL